MPGSAKKTGLRRVEPSSAVEDRAAPDSSIPINTPLPVPGRSIISPFELFLVTGLRRPVPTCSDLRC